MTELWTRARRKTLKAAARFGIHNVHWEDIEYFDRQWKDRLKEMAKFVLPGERVMDLGCGQMWLREMLKNNEYYPVDYVSRGAKNMLVADLNRYEYPDVSVDTIVISGTLEYIKDYKWLIEMVAHSTQRCIVSYCTIEHYPNMGFRRARAWQNHLSRHQLIDAFGVAGMNLVAESHAVPLNSIFVFNR